MIHIELFGQTYAFRTESETARARRAAQLFLDEVAEVEAVHAKEGVSLSKMAVLVMVALNIAEQNLDMRMAESSFLDNISARSNRLINRLDSTRC